MTTITGSLLDLGVQGPYTDVAVVFDLVGSKGTPAGLAFVVSTGQRIYGSQRVEVDEVGRYTTGLTSLDDVTPAGLRWRQQVVGPGVAVSVTYGDVREVDADWVTILSPPPEAVPDPASAYQLRTQRGVPDGYATLDDAGTVPQVQLPDSLALAADLHALDAETVKVTWTVDRLRTEHDLIIVPHRGAGDLIAPENTLEAMRVGVSQGLGCIDAGDLRLLAGCTTDLALCHDNDVAAFLASTGVVGDYTMEGWRLQTVDASVWFGGGYGNLRPCTATDVMREFGNKVVLYLELKSTGVVVRSVYLDLVDEYDLVESSVVGSFNFPDLSVLAAAGLHTQFITNVGNDRTPQELVDAGIEAVAIHKGVADGVFEAMADAGLDVYMFTISRHIERVRAENLGCKGVYATTPLYTAGDPTKYRVTRSPFRSGAYPQGLLHRQAFDQSTNPASRGTLRPDGRHLLGPNSDDFTVLQGYSCPIEWAAASYTIDVDLEYSVLDADTSRFAIVTFCSPDDREYVVGGPGEIGYSVILRQTGFMGLFFRDGTQASSSQSVVGPSVNTGAINVAGTVAHLRVLVTPTHITVTRTDTGNPAHTVTWAHAAIRGAYYHVGKAHTNAAAIAYEVTGVAAAA